MQAPSKKLNSDTELVAHLVKKITENAGGGDFAQLTALLSIVALIFVIFTEPFKLILRKNIGKLSISKSRFILAALIYTFWGGLLWYFLIDGTIRFHFFLSNETALKVGVALYLLLGLFTLLFGIIRLNEADKNTVGDTYRGDSIFLNRRTNNDLIWCLWEPLACFLISLPLTILNPFLGSPLLITSIAFWGNEYFQVNNVWNVTDKKVARARMQVIRNEMNVSDEDTYTPVN